MPQVFISYVQKDRPDFVLWLANYLNDLPGKDIHAWFDQQLTPASPDDLSWQIQPRLESADFVLVVLTKGIESESSYVHKEVAFAEAQKKIIIPLMLEDCKVPLLLSDRLWIDFTADWDVAVSRLIQYIKGEIPFPRVVPTMTHTTRAIYHQYLRTLIQRLGILPVSTVDLLSEERLRLDQVWTPLSTSTLDDTANQVTRRLLGPKKLSVMQVLARHPHAILMGDPGAGKSTAARYIALCLAGAEIDNKKTLPLGLAELGSEWGAGKLCPIYLELREFAAKAMLTNDVSGDDLLRFILDELERSPSLTGFVPNLRQQLSNGSCMIILDGMDEVPQALHRRLTVLDCVRDFCQRYSNCRILVTTRTYAYRRSDWRLDGFEEAEIAPFDDEQIDIFINHWYAAVTRHQPQLVGRGVALKREITERPEDLGFLARRPLLLALMASIHSRTKDKLPTSRATLYRYITQLLLDHWEKSKNVINPITGEAQFTPSSLAHYIGHGISVEDLRSAINFVAFEAHKGTPGGATETNGEADITGERLALTLHKFLHRDPNGTPLPSEFDLVDELRDRSGILMAYDEDVYRFPHRTFQEYMAACHLCSDELFPNELVSLVGREPERWREVLLFAAGEVIQGKRQTHAWQLLDSLVPDQFPDAVPLTQFDPLWFAAFYAGLVLDANDMQAPNRGAFRATYNRIVEWLEKLIEHGALSPKDRCTATLTLSNLGDTREGIGIGPRKLPQIKWSQAIPLGRIELGTDDALYRVAIGAFRVSVFCVTNAQYQLFLDTPDGWTNLAWWDFSQEALAWRRATEQPALSVWTELTCPRTNVTWYEAIAFCQWLASKPGFEGVRLPSEAEWEYAARSADGRVFPWGNTYIDGQANIRHASNGDITNNIGRTSPVGIFPTGVSPFGTLDMMGNVFEWCQTEYRSFLYDPYDGREELSGIQSRSVRGGSWRTTMEKAKPSERGQLPPWEQRSDCGFRLCLPI